MGIANARIVFGLSMAFGGLLVSEAAAKPAQCFTTDDGYYACDFRGLDRAGSFRIRAPGRPAYVIEVYESGRAYGFADFGSGSVSLPGEYIRSRRDRACWDNTETSTQICAW